VVGQVTAVSDDDGAGAQIPQQSFQISEQLVRGLVVKACGYLVDEEQTRVVR